MTDSYIRRRRPALTDQIFGLRTDFEDELGREDRAVTRQNSAPPPSPNLPPHLALNASQSTNVLNNKCLWITRRLLLESGLTSDTSGLTWRGALAESLARRAANGLPRCATCNTAAGVSSTKYQDGAPWKQQVSKPWPLPTRWWPLVLAGLPIGVYHDENMSSE